MLRRDRRTPPGSGEVDALVAGKEAGLDGERSAAMRGGRARTEGNPGAGDDQHQPARRAPVRDRGRLEIVNRVDAVDSVVVLVADPDRSTLRNDRVRAVTDW